MIISSRQNGKNTEQDAKAFREILSLADQNPGVSKRFVVASSKETKYYDISLVDVVVRPGEDAL